MFKFIFSVLFLTFLRLRVAYPQAINWSALNLLQPQEAILEVPRSIPQFYNPQILEPTPNIPFPSLPSVSPISPVSSISPISPNTATTVISDCSPAVCKNLVNTIQLMIVCNLLQNAQGNSDLAVQLAAPIINEVISSPNLSCGCSNPLFTNPIFPSLPPISPSYTPPPTVISPNMFPNVLTTNVIPNYSTMPIYNPNGLIYNLS